MSKTNRINEIEERLSQLEEEKTLLLHELSSLKEIAIEDNRTTSILGQKVSSKTPETPEEKINLFLQLFRCREDVYPKFWENKTKGIKGYSPACQNEWKKGICNKPQVKCADCNNKQFYPLDENTARSHLEGRITIGTYAIKENDTCTFIAADFDKATWKEDVQSYKNAADKMGISVAIEKSRSGNGAHAWIFFTKPIPSFLARKLGTVILSYASSNRYTLSLDSYDRFFPNQDSLPKGGFGNLIALPLQRGARENGNTVFLDDNLFPYENQWEYLSQLRRISEKNVRNILEDFLLDRDGEELYLSDKYDISEAEREIEPMAGNLDSSCYSGEISIEFGSKLSIDMTSIPAKLVSALKRTATFANPKFFELQRMRFSTWNTPRYICCASFDKNRLLLPRGTLNACQQLIEKVGGILSVNDVRLKSNEVDLAFTGTLTEVQEIAVTEILQNDCGVLVAPPGIGKTVMGCAVIGKRKVPTLVLVHRKQLVDQWKSQIAEFLNIEEKKIGLLGGGRKKKSEIVDIAMLQTLSRMDNVSEIFSMYEQVIIDECHHIPAASFEAVLNESPARYFLGLTATPYRKDGWQAIIHMQCGPIRHEIQDKAGADLIKRTIVKETSFSMPVEAGPQPPMHEVWNELTTDKERLKLIAVDVKNAVAENRFPLIISERKEHLSLLSEEIKNNLSDMNAKEFILVGDMGKKARKKVLEDIKEAISSINKPYILSTSSLIGEGFDLPELDTLFLAMPFSFKGRMIQYAGRLHRECEGKTDVVIYDYLDISSGLTISMFKKRVSAYKQMGYEIENSANQKVNRWVRQGSLF